MRAARRTVEAAGRAPLHAHLDPFDLHRLVERGTEIIFFVLVLLRSGEDSRVHESGHTEVGEGEEEDHGNVDGNDKGEILRQPWTREAEEEGGGSDKESGGCRHRDISAGAKWTGRSRSRDIYSSPNSPTTEARHQRQRERGGRQREREGGIYGLPTVNGALQVKMANVGFVREEGP